MGGKKPVGVDPSRGNCRSRRGRRLHPLFQTPSSSSSLDTLGSDFSLFSSLGDWILEPTSYNENSFSFESIDKSDEESVDVDQQLDDDDNLKARHDVIPDKLFTFDSHMFMNHHESFSSAPESGFHNQSVYHVHSQKDAHSENKMLSLKVEELTRLVHQLQSQVTRMSQMNQVANPVRPSNLSVGPSVSKFSSRSSLPPVKSPSSSTQTVTGVQYTKHIQIKNDARIHTQNRLLSRDHASKNRSLVLAEVDPVPSLNFTDHDPSPVKTQPLKTRELNQSPSVSPSRPILKCEQLTNDSPPHCLDSIVDKPVIGQVMDQVTSAEWTKLVDRISTLEGRQAFVQSKISQLDAAFGGTQSSCWRKASKKLQNLLNVSDTDNNTFDSDDKDEEGNDVNTDVNTSPVEPVQQSVEPAATGKKRNKKKTKQLSTSNDQTKDVNVTNSSNVGSNSEGAVESTHESSGDNIMVVATATRHTQYNHQNPNHSSSQNYSNQNNGPGQSPNRFRSRDSPWNGSNSFRRWHYHDVDSTVVTTGSTINVMYMSPSPICYYYPLPQYAFTGVPTNQYPTYANNM